MVNDPIPPLTWDLFLAGWRFDSLNVSDATGVLSKNTVEVVRAALNVPCKSRQFYFFLTALYIFIGATYTKLKRCCYFQRDDLRAPHHRLLPVFCCRSQSSELGLFVFEVYERPNPPAPHVHSFKKVSAGHSQVLRRAGKEDGSRPRNELIVLPVRSSG